MSKFFSEVSKSECISKVPEIHPETSMSKDEAKNYIENNLAKIKDLDDNGKEYKKGNELKPNITYELNGAKYETDSQGRIIRCESKIEINPNRHQRKSMNVSMDDIAKGDQLPTDQRSHLKGDQLEGSNQQGNLVAMDRTLNQGPYKVMENNLAKNAATGRETKLKVDIKYKNKSFRPDSFKCTYTIDGEKTRVTFKNKEINNGK